MAISAKRNTEITSLEEMVAATCFCKLRERCGDKNSSECMRHRNIVAEFMAAKPLKTIK